MIKETEGVEVRGSTYSFQKGEVIPANQEIEILTTRGEAQTAWVIKYINSIDWTYSVIYEDVYGAQWKLSQESNFPVAISK